MRITPDERAPGSLAEKCLTSVEANAIIVGVRGRLAQLVRALP